MVDQEDSHPGQIFRTLVADNKILPIVGVINAYCAKLAQSNGFRAIYLSGAGVANASLGVPDLAITTCSDLVVDIARITEICNLPLLVDIDTGFGSYLNRQRTIKNIEKAGAAGVHLEDQISVKRCGHRPNKKIISIPAMQQRIKSCVDARTNNAFVIMARTDSIAGEGLDAAIERANNYAQVGADMIFAEAVTTLDDYKKFTKSIDIPLLANITEFGKTPLFTLEQLSNVGVKMALYPLSAFRAMSMAANNVYKTIAELGTQKSILDTMQTREELYQIIDYYKYEQLIDNLGENYDE